MKIFMLMFLLQIFGNLFCTMLLKVTNGTSVSFIELWNEVGYTVGESTSDVYRSTLIDGTFTPGCPSRLYFRFLDAGNDTFDLRFREPFTNSSFTEWLTSLTIVSSQLDSKKLGLELTPDEDVIFKGFQKDDPSYLYFAVYLPRNLTSMAGYPKFYVIPAGQYHPSHGSIPGNESLFDEYVMLKISGKYADTCFLTTTDQALTTTNTYDNTTAKDEMMNSNSAYDKQDYRGVCYKNHVDKTTITTASVLWTKDTRSPIECGLKCSNNIRDCKSIFYMSDTSTCIGLAHAEDTDDRPINAVHFTQEDCYN